MDQKIYDKYSDYISQIIVKLGPKSTREDHAWCSAALSAMLQTKYTNPPFEAQFNEADGVAWQSAIYTVETDMANSNFPQAIKDMAALSPIMESNKPGYIVKMEAPKQTKHHKKKAA